MSTASATADAGVETAAAPGCGGPATRVVPAVLAVATLVAVATAVAGADAGALHTLRAVTTVAAAVLAPGWAVAGFVRGVGLAGRAVLATAVGLAAAILAGQVMVVTGAWHPVGLLLVSALVSVPVLAWHARRTAP